MHSFVGGHFTTDYKRRRAEVLRADGYLTYRIISRCSNQIPDPLLQDETVVHTASDVGNTEFRTVAAATALSQRHLGRANPMKHIWLRNLREAVGGESAVFKPPACIVE